MRVKEALSLDDLHSEAVNLHHVIDVAMAHILDCDFGTGENRNHTLDRASALVRVARDLCEQLRDHLEVRQ